MKAKKIIIILYAMLLLTSASIVFADVIYEDWMGDDLYLYVTVTNNESFDIYLTDVVIRFYYEDNTYEDLIWEYDSYLLDAGYYIELGPFGGNYDGWTSWEVLEINYLY